MKQWGNEAMRQPGHICLVTDRKLLTPDARTVRNELAALEGFLADAVEAGVDVIQLRERDLEAGQLRDLAARVGRRAADTRTRVLVNDRGDVARAAGADGVHLRADGPPVSRVRTLSSGRFIVGRSAHTIAEARAADDDGADYVLFGTVFPGGSKGGAPGNDRLLVLQEAARSARTPVVAIGGIDPGRAARCLQAGAAGVAAISIFLPEGRAPLAMGVARAVAALRLAMVQ
jgi:thiamine-phosphate pyrophosphorylase